MPTEPVRDDDQDPVEVIMAELLASDDEPPPAAIAAACAAHPDLAGELQRRLEFLRHSRAPAGKAAIGSTAGDRIGHFRIVRTLGGGGMGVVYLAIEEPLGREVALKLVRPELLLFGSAQKRFLREVEAIAALDHPGIVRIYSFGEQDGVPFYAMERVDGRTLAQLLDELRRTADGAPPPAALLQPAARDWALACVAVVLQVAKALAHAHARGIIHRDIKPSNVMLDRDGRARLIDFGLALVKDQESMTRSGVQPGSLAYMSPEQVRGEDLDARTDVWSLGVVLYELLTLRSPFLADTEAETRRRILATDPAPPSSSNSRIAWEAATVTLTALAPERQRRYPTMLAFAADLEAFLQHRPIAAQRPGPLLRARRWLQRHPTRAAAIALLFVTCCVLPSALLLQERRARAQIEQEATTARQVVTFLEELFHEAEPARARGASVPVRVILDRGTARVRTQLADQPAVAAALLEAMGNVYLNLGLLDQSEQLLQDAAKLREQLGTEPAGLQQVRSSLARVAAEKGDDATSERLWRAVIEALPGADAIALAQADLHLARALWRQDRMDAAEQLLVSAVATLRRLLPADDLRLGFALADHAEFLEERDDPDRAAPLFVEALARCAQRLPPDHPDLIAVQLLAARNDLSRNRAAAAETKLRQLLHTAETVFDQNHPLLAQVREALAVALTFSDQFAAARDLLDQALAAYQVIHQPPHFALARARMLEADIAFELGDLGRAETAAAASLAMYEQLFPHGHLDLAAVLGNQARVQAALGHLDVAQQCAERALQMHQQLGQRKPSHLALAQAHLAYVQAHHNQLEPAERNAREALARLPPAGNEQARRNARCYLGEVLCFCWKGTEAEAVLREVLADDARSPTPPSPAARGWSLFVLGWAVLLQDKTTPGKGKPEEAEPLLRESLQLRRQAHGDRHPLVGIVADELGVALARMGRLDEAAEQIELAVSIRREHSGADSEYLALPLLNLGTLRTMQKRPADAVPLATDCLSVLEHHGTAGHPQVVALVQLWLRLLPHLPAETARTVLPRLSAFADRLLPADNPLRGELQTASKKLGG